MVIGSCFDFEATQIMPMHTHQHPKKTKSHTMYKFFLFNSAELAAKKFLSHINNKNIDIHNEIIPS